MAVEEGRSHSLGQSLSLGDSPLALHLPSGCLLVGLSWESPSFSHHSLSHGCGIGALLGLERETVISRPGSRAEGRRQAGRERTFIEYLSIELHARPIAYLTSFMITVSVEGA